MNFSSGNFLRIYAPSTQQATLCGQMQTTAVLLNLNYRVKRAVFACENAYLTLDSLIL